MLKKFVLLGFIGTLFFALPGFAADPISTSFFSNKAVSGYDSVAYFTEGKPVKGSSRYTTDYMGAEWQFSSAENLALFKANPAKYAPQYGGYCAWAVAHGYTASGDPEQWHIEDGKLYLNYNKSVKEQWFPRKAELIPIADKNFPDVIK